MNKFFLFLFIWCVLSAAYVARPLEIPIGWQKRGEATTVLFGFALYRGILYTQSAKVFDKNSKYALSLEYLREFKATTLVKATVKEIRRTKGLSAEDFEDLKFELMQCFVNVKAGDRITAIARNANKINIFYNGTKRCDLERTNIRNQFFGIWLGDKTRDAKGSARLKGTP